MELQTSIRLSSAICEYACLRTIEECEKRAKKAWEDRIAFELNMKPFLWILNRPAKSKDEAIRRIQADAQISFGIGPDHEENFRIRRIRTILLMAQRSDFIVVTKEDFEYIGHNVPARVENSYR